MGLKVIGAGLGRTGTTSLKLALEALLGGPCYHMVEVRERAADPDIWGAAYEGHLPDWTALFADYEATVDWPAAPFWSELAEAFPDVPIVLSTRDADAWWASSSQTIFLAMEVYFSPEAPEDGWTRMGRGMLMRFSPEWREEQAAKAAYLAYNDHVRATAPPDRLVEWTPGDGWGPLCAALGAAVPHRPFPHTNTTAQARSDLGLDAAT